jgi:RHS repeat-associated protein
VWLGDLPVATIRPDGTSPAIFYVHPDHLGTPRAITRPSDNQLVWKWDNTEAFGNSAPDENPSALGVFVYNMRFPGQYHDSETGKNYNYFRDYDRSIGRYIESDPIGLSGGINSYGYVWQSPLAYFDLLGLECWWLDQGNAVQCKPTGLRRQKPTQRYVSKEFFPAPDPTSPSIAVGPKPPVPQPGWQLVWRTVFHDKGYWEAEFSCHSWATLVCKEQCGKLTFLPGNMDLGKKWEGVPNSDYDDVSYGAWSNVTAPTGPWDLEGVHGPRSRGR